MKCIFIYNPLSGKGALKNQLTRIKKRLETKYDEVVVYSTASLNDMMNTVKKAASIYDAIIFSGGDGTFNTVVNVIAKEDIKPILGYIPSGTANDIAHNLKIPKNIDKAIDIILKGDYVSHDIGRVNDKYFVYVCGCGTFSGLSYRTNQTAKRYLKRIAYVIDGFHEVPSPTVVDAKITMDDMSILEVKCPLLLILNSRSVGGVPFFRKGHLNDGLFDVVIVKKYVTWVGSIITTILLGIFRRRTETRYYKLCRAKKIKVEVSNDITWCLDGEKGMNGSIEVENLPGYIKIFVPTRHYRAKSIYLLEEGQSKWE